MSEPHPLSAVKFDPEGIDKVVKYLRQDPVFRQAGRQTTAMAMAFFAADAYDDGQHNPKKQKNFHPVYRTFRKGCNDNNKPLYDSVRDSFAEVVFDFLTTWDRLNEGATYMVHTNGTRRARTTACPEEGIFEVYAPPHIIATFPEAGFSLARIVQDFAENVGTDAMLRWDKLSYRTKWAEKGLRDDARSQQTALIPPSESTRFTFYGRTPGTLQPLIDAYRASRPAVEWSLSSLPPPPSQPATRSMPPPTASSSSAQQWPQVFAPPPTPEASSRGPARDGPPTSSARRGGEITETDWSEGAKVYPYKSNDYVERVIELEAQVSEQESYQEVLELELVRLRDENTLLVMELANFRVRAGRRVVPPPTNDRVAMWSASVPPSSTHPRGVAVARSTSTASDVGAQSPQSTSVLPPGTIAAPRAISEAPSRASPGISRASSVAPRPPPSTPHPQSSPSCPPSSAPRPPSSTHRSRVAAPVTPSSPLRTSADSPRASSSRVRLSANQNDSAPRPASSASSARTAETVPSRLEFQMISPPPVDIEVFGEATANLFRVHDIDVRHHTALWTIYMEIDTSEWPSAVRRLLPNHRLDVVDKVVSAMKIDANYRQQYEGEE